MLLSIIKLFIKHKDNDLDLATQKVLYNQYFKLIYSIAYRYCVDDNASKDIVQETFIRAFKYINSYKEQENGSFEAWLVTIAKNESIKYIQKHSKTKEILEENINIASNDLPHSLDEEIINKLAIDDIKLVIKKLPDIYRFVFLLRYLHGFTFKEIGDKLSIDENTARQRLFRARKTVQKAIQASWERDQNE